jgi:hypothetical protein
VPVPHTVILRSPMRAVQRRSPPILLSTFKSLRFRCRKTRQQPAPAVTLNLCFFCGATLSRRLP